MGFKPVSYTEYTHHIFQYQQQTEYVRFFIVNWQGEEIKFDPVEMEKVYWVDLETLLKDKDTYSEMTRFWVENVNWKKMMGI